jgi:hypothetical protein
MPRKQKKYHYIYRTTCVVTGKFYVGMHSTDDLQDGYLGSGKILGYSLRKHGRESHRLEILEMCGSREELKIREKEVVNEEMLSNPLNINLKYGGEGGWEHIGSGSSWKGFGNFKRSDVAKKINDKRTQKLLIDHEFARAYGEKLSRANQGLQTWLGKKHSTESKEKISQTSSGKHRGDRNSQFGTCWVTRNGHTVKIKASQLNEYLSVGYSRGRK